VLSDATLKLDSAVIKDCTNVGVIVGSLRIPTGAQTEHATITNTIITDYRANGIVVPGSGSTLTISHSKIIGDAPDAFGIIGISFHTGAKAKIVNNIISENKCKIPNTCGPNPITQVQAIGILVDSAGKGSVISNNYVSNNDAGIVVFGTSGCCIIDHNKLTDNHFFGIVIADGEHTISNTKIFGGKVGVLAIAFSVNTVATLDHVKIIDAKIPVQALSSEGFTATVNVVFPYFFAP
jgi:parallel beta-helix repeat protein